MLFDRSKKGILYLFLTAVANYGILVGISKSDFKKYLKIHIQENNSNINDPKQSLKF